MRRKQSREPCRHQDQARSRARRVHHLGGKWCGEGKTAVSQNAAADLFFLFREDKNFGLLVAVEIGEPDGFATDEAREVLAGAQADAFGLVIDDELGVGGISCDEVDQSVAVEVAEVERTAAGVALGQRIEWWARLRLAAVSASSSVSSEWTLSGPDWPSIVSNSEPGLPLTSPSVAARRGSRANRSSGPRCPPARETNANGVVGTAVEQDEVVAAVAIHVDRFDHPGVLSTCAASVPVRLAYPSALEDRDDFTLGQQSEVVAAVAIEVADGKGTRGFNRLAGVDLLGFAKLAVPLAVQNH